LIVSFKADRDKTWKALRIAVKKFVNILPVIGVMLMLVSILVCVVSDEIILKYLGNNNRYLAVSLASIFGSVSIMPGFVAFPLCGILLKQGVPYMVLSAFTTTLMMVGVATYPLEKSYLGHKVAILRNLGGFVIAWVIAITTGIFFGEVISW
jgi:uncharacterized membrane protein YraQ (UPF0718 family)